MSVLTGSAVTGSRFERTLLARPGTEPDTSTRVTWIQGRHLYCDLRQPAALPTVARPETIDDLLALTGQEGFAGPLIDHGDHVEWVRAVSFHPLGHAPDAGTLSELDENTLVEHGVHEHYTEHWRRTARSSDIEEHLVEDEVTGTIEVLVRVGEVFGYARGPAATHAAAPLADRITRAANLSDAFTHLDCEISIGVIGNGHWTITSSTLPHRSGAAFDPAHLRSRA